MAVHFSHAVYVCSLRIEKKFSFLGATVKNQNKVSENKDKRKFVCVCCPPDRLILQVSKRQRQREKTEEKGKRKFRAASLLISSVNSNCGPRVNELQASF